MTYILRSVIMIIDIQPDKMTIRASDYVLLTQRCRGSPVLKMTKINVHNQNLPFEWFLWRLEVRVELMDKMTQGGLQHSVHNVAHKILQPKKCNNVWVELVIKK